MVRASPKVPSVSPLESKYRRALSASVVAHARFLAAEGEKGVTQRQLVRRKTTWQLMEARKAKIRELLLRATETQKGRIEEQEPK